MFYLLKGDEFNSDALSNEVASFLHIFVIVLLAECEKSWRPRLTERPHFIHSSLVGILQNISISKGH